MNEPTPIVFYVPCERATVSDDGTVDTEDLLTRIGATDITHAHADLHAAHWAGLDIHASAQACGPLVRFVVELRTMDWIEMRVRNPDDSLMHPERSRALIDAFAAAAEALDCDVAFKSMSVLPGGWANWDPFFPDFDRVATHRDARDLVREMIDFGYTSGRLGVEWCTGHDGYVLDATPGMTTDRGTIWFGERMPALT